MGEVYKARDTRLDRVVAIKILPDALSGDPQLRERFDREARAISQLDHPHICTVYDVGERDGSAYLVMQYLEGETLERRLAQGSGLKGQVGLPLNEALTIAIQIADALDKAHTAGIVHRDLKPGNIMLTRSGARLLDFGLAKSLAPAIASGNASILPTTPATMTAEGTILGTLQYMAPEQLEGRTADARTDIFAFGAVLYEMVTGRKAFDGKSQASLISAIMSSEPAPPSRIQPLAPGALDSIVARCLAKDPDERWYSIHDIAIQLRVLAAHNGSSSAGTATAKPGTERRWMAMSGVLAAACAGLILLALVRGEQSDRQTVRLTMRLPGDSALTDATVSPDGRRVAFIARSDGKPALWIRSLDSLVAEVVAGTDGLVTGSVPFWSPDSTRIGFFAQGKLKTVEPGSGPPKEVCDAGVGRGATWNRSGVIVFAPNVEGPLVRVSAGGGTPTPATALDVARNERSHRWPQFLPDGKHFLYFARSPKAEDTGVYVGQLDSPRVTRVMTAESAARFTAPDLLLFWRAGSLLAQHIDENTFQVTGSPTPVAQSVLFNRASNEAQFSASDTGVLTYIAAASPQTQVSWVARDGTVTGTVGPVGLVSSVALSPDQTKAALTVGDSEGGSNIWVANLSRGQTWPLTSGRGRQLMPVWSYDGKHIVYALQRPDFSGTLFRLDVDGGAAQQVRIGDDHVKFPTDWTRDGLLVFHTFDPSTQGDIWTAPAEGGDPRSVIRTSSNDQSGRLSPNGRWMAYSSDETDRFEIYVQSFRDGRGKLRISTNGGRLPEWRVDGRELYFIDSQGRLVATTVETAGNTLEVGKAQVLFDAQAPPVAFPDPVPYAVMSDGQKFLIARAIDRDRSSSLVIVLNWQEDLKRRTPAK
jgi:Tol biopolymer transport system component